MNFLPSRFEKIFYEPSLRSIPLFILLIFIGSLSIACAPVSHESNIQTEIEERQRLVAALREISQEVLPYFPYEYCADGCAARSYLLQAILAKHQITSRSLFLVGNLEPKEGLIWKYHVAPLVRVGNTVGVIDPALKAMISQKKDWGIAILAPISIDQWIKLSLGKGSTKFRIALTNYSDLPQFTQGLIPNSKTLIYLNEFNIEHQDVLYEALDEKHSSHQFNENYLNRYANQMKEFNDILSPQQSANRNLNLSKSMSQLKEALRTADLIQEADDSLLQSRHPAFDPWYAFDDIVYLPDDAQIFSNRDPVHLSLKKEATATPLLPSPINQKPLILDGSADQISSILEAFKSGDLDPDALILSEDMLNVALCSTP